MGNQWANCQNIEPGTASDGYHEPEWYETGYKLVGQGNTLSYRDFALATVERYKHDPTIAMWSLLNEAEAGTVVTGTTCPDEVLASKAMAGFVADMSSAISGLPRDWSFCQHVGDDAPLGIANAAKTKRVKGRPSRKMLSIGAHLGVSLQTKNKHNIGSPLRNREVEAYSR